MLLSLVVGAGVVGIVLLWSLSSLSWMCVVVMVVVGGSVAVVGVIACCRGCCRCCCVLFRVLLLLLACSFDVCYLMCCVFCWLVHLPLL